MNSKKIIILVVAIVIALVALIWGGSRIVQFIQQQNIRNEYIEEAREFLESDKLFIPLHGKIVSFEAREDMPTLIEDSVFEEYYMTFDCKTDTETMVIRVHKWYDSGWKYKYVIH